MAKHIRYWIGEIMKEAKCDEATAERIEEAIDEGVGLDWSECNNLEFSVAVKEAKKELNLA